MDTSIVDKILRKSKGKLDSCEVCFTASEVKEAKFASSKLKSSEGKGSRSIAVRGFIGGRMGFYTTSDLSSPDEIVDATVDLAREGGRHEIELPSDFGSATVDTYDAATEALSPADLAGIGRELIGRVQAHHPKYLNEVQVSSESDYFHLANSNGGRGEFRTTAAVCVLSSQFTDHSGFTEICEYDFPVCLPDDRFAHLADRVIGKLNYCEKAARAETGTYEILLLPKAVSILGTLNLALNARAVLKGFSPWMDKLGEIVADEKLEIIDDPLAAGYIGSQPFDDEGTPSARKALIDKGTLRLVLNDLYSAARLGHKPTGNAFRAGAKSEPRASASTLFITEGEKDFSALVAGMKRGIVVDQVMGTHTSSFFSGDFNVNIDMGWLVENGEIVGRVKDCMLAGNVFNWIRNNLIDVGSGAVRTSPSTCFPPLLFSGGKIASAE